MSIEILQTKKIHRIGDCSPGDIIHHIEDDSKIFILDRYAHEDSTRLTCLKIKDGIITGHTFFPLTSDECYRYKVIDMNIKVEKY